MDVVPDIADDVPLLTEIAIGTPDPHPEDLAVSQVKEQPNLVRVVLPSAKSASAAGPTSHHVVANVLGHDHILCILAPVSILPIGGGGVPPDVDVVRVWLVREGPRVDLHAVPLHIVDVAIHYPEIPSVGERLDPVMVRVPRLALQTLFTDKNISKRALSGKSRIV